MLGDRIPSRADIKLIRSLGQKKFREELGLFVVEGEKMVGEALTQKRFPVEAVYRLSDVGEEVMGRMSHLSSPSPALAVLRIPPEEMQDNAPAPALPSGLCLGLDSVRDPYLSPDCADLYNPKTIQATMGSIFRQKTATCDLVHLARNCRTAGIPVYSTALEGGEDIRTVPLKTDRALVIMGSERDGVSPALLDESVRRIYIPSAAEGTSDRAESLNVAIATAITCYEMRLRRIPTI